jgi:Holliday junction DNA helicase RuvA
LIGKLKGKVDSISGNTILLDVQGVCYEVRCTKNCLSLFTSGDKAEIVIFTEVKPEHIRLFGFEDQYEKQVFLLLMQVKGIGPKTAADLISKIDKHELVRYIGRSDLTRLQAVKGVGRKTAERIIVELKDKIGEYLMESRSQSGLDIEVEVINPENEALQALLALGFPRKDAERAIQQVQDLPGFAKLDSGEIVKEALRYV